MTRRKNFFYGIGNTDHYEALKNKLVQKKEMYADEVCCLAIARNRDIPVDALYQQLPSAIAEIRTGLNDITIDHLDLIENALAVSMFVMHANKNNKSGPNIALDNSLKALFDKLWYREIIRKVREEKSNRSYKHTFLNLSGIVLAGVSKLGLMKLTGACLDGADLSGCKLLNSLRLDHASLRYANFVAADLSHVCLEHSDLFMANLTSTIQFGTKLNGATFFSRPIHDLTQLNNELKQILFDINGVNSIKDVMRNDYSSELHEAIVVDLISRLNNMGHVSPKEKAVFISKIAPLLGYERGSPIGFFQSPLASHLTLLFNAQRELLAAQNALPRDQPTQSRCVLQ